MRVTYLSCIVTIIMLSLSTISFAVSSDTYNAWVNESSKNYKAGNFEEAIPLFTKVIDSGELSGDPLSGIVTLRGRSYCKVGQYNLGIADFNRVLASNYTPKYEVYSQRARCYGGLKNYTKAEEDYYLSIASNPKESDQCKRCLALSYLSLARIVGIINKAWDEGYEHYLMAVDISNDEEIHPKLRDRIEIEVAEGALKRKEYAKALPLVQRLAHKGNESAQFFLAKMYYKGHAVDKDYEKTAFWGLKAANQGHVRAQNAMGISYMKGRGVKQNYVEAMHWFHQAADQGYYSSMKRIGSLYLKGLGVEKNVIEGIHWYRKAAEGNSSSAMNELAWLYATHPDQIIRNAEKALYWAKKAVQLKPDKVYYIGTLAAAYAESGDFYQAIENQKKAIRLSNDDDYIKQANIRLKGYEASRPWRDTEN